MVCRKFCRQAFAAIHIDVAGGYGNDAYNQMNDLNMNVVGLNGGLRSDGNDRSGKLSYYNMRAEWWWGLREALDPLLGVGLALPPGREVLADLTAPRYEVRPGGKILVDEAAKKKVHLTEKETAILRYLYRAGRRPVPRETLLNEVWGYNPGVTTHTLETHIYRLRQKIEPDPSNARLLVTESGGYRLVA